MRSGIQSQCQTNVSGVHARRLLCFKIMVSSTCPWSYQLREIYSKRGLSFGLHLFANMVINDVLCGCIPKQIFSPGMDQLGASTR